MMRVTFGLFTPVSGSGPRGSLVFFQLIILSSIFTCYRGSAKEIPVWLVQVQSGIFCHNLTSS